VSLIEVVAAGLLLAGSFLVIRALIAADGGRLVPRPGVGEEASPPFRKAA
jgi:hypothetical protein